MWLRRLLFEAAYQGTRYHGYQVQKNAVTVAGTIQDAVEKVWGCREGITGCSRTDTGVHARQFFFHMDTHHTIPTDAAVRALNVNLPGDIAILSCREVAPDFHARYNVCYKEYTYQIWNSAVKNPFLDGLAMHHKYPLDVERMHTCGQEFVGTHDFRGFCSTGSKAKPTAMDGGESTIRTIYSFEVERQGDMVLLRVCGNGFLYNMVRIMVGTLLMSGPYQLKPGDLTAILAGGNRADAGITAPAAGLYLTKVSYLPFEGKGGGPNG
ncbi:MAG TPA: tRNA pseudouridine(38-40) synthase TruA [Candidatus Faecivivens stercoripullorum]|uniref:tRNA pseudouridine synthase A n=1 Tax=Candidatus Faecivivens stercoripullorum TaxID=2840805 RepID=A0A9D1H4A0_9FIRM|nr:tRNA pseudouridine(38-40) synthase TruA [Candidatus Faecivivens stercoripullorum]